MAGSSEQRRPEWKDLPKWPGLLLLACPLALIAVCVLTIPGKRVTAEAVQLRGAIAHYALDHGGELPASLDQLVATDYLREGRHKEQICYYVVPYAREPLIELEPELPLLQLDRFEVPWGSHVREFVERNHRLYWRGKRRKKVLLVDPGPGLYRFMALKGYRRRDADVYLRLCAALHWMEATEDLSRSGSSQ